jgi:hypothetical protein
VSGPLVDGEPRGLSGSSRAAVSLAMAAAQHPVSLSPELVDLLTEAVAMPASAAARAEVVSAMLLRALDAISWRQEVEGDGSGESSLLRVVTAAEAHRQRMAMAPDRRR